MSTRAVTRRRLLVLVLSFLLSALLFAGLVAILGAGEEALRATLRASGRLSLVLFLLPISASALASLLPGAFTRRLRKFRAELGLVFAGAHLAHLGLIARLAQMPEVRFPLFVIVVGGVGFVIIAAMIATSFPSLARALGAPRWRLLHRFGVHYIAVIFTYDMVKGMARSPLEYAPLGLALAVVFGLRVVAAKRRSHLRLSA